VGGIIGEDPVRSTLKRQGARGPSGSSSSAMRPAEMTTAQSHLDG
jgi:hypothetical protein